jgi:hypothetical protein
MRALTAVKVIRRSSVIERKGDACTNPSFGTRYLINIKAILPPRSEEKVTRYNELVKSLPLLLLVGKNLSTVLGSPKFVNIATNAPKLIKEVAKPITFALKR